MQDFWLNIDHPQGDQTRPTELLLAAGTGFAAIIFSKAIALLTGANLPYLFVVAGVALSVARGGLSAGIVALAIGVGGTLCLDTGNPVVQSANTIIVILLCLIISGAGEAFLRLRAREKSLTERCSHREAMLQRMFDTSQAVILIIGYDHRIVAVNSAGCRLFDLAREAIIGVRVPDLFEGHDAIEIGVHIIKTPDGRARRVRLSATDLPIRGEHFRTVYIRDETATIVAAEALATTQQELNQVARAAALGLLGSAIAHELNQPLAAATIYINAASSILTKLDSVPPAAVAALSDAAGQVLRTAAVLKQMRDFIGHRPTDASWTDVRAIIMDAAKLGGLALKQADAVLEISIDPAAGHALVDPIQVQQVLVNLLVNAADAVRDRTRRTVQLSARTDVEGAISFIVEDSGAGVPDDMFDMIFRPFCSTKSDGLGVGLAISTRIVEALGSRLTGTNGSSHGGAVFCFTLPGRRYREMGA